MNSPSTTRDSSERASLGESLVQLRWPFALLVTSAALALGLRLMSRQAGIPFRWRVESPANLAFALLGAIVLACGVGLLRGSAGGRRVSPSRARMAAGPQILAEVVLIVGAVFFAQLVAVNLARQVASWNPDLFDSPAWRLDASLGFGPSPVADFVAVLGQLGLLPVVDFLGPIVWPLAPLAIALVWSRPDLAVQRWRVGCATLLVVVGASAIRLAWPTLGPAAYRSSQFLWLDHAPIARLMLESGLRAAGELRQFPWAAVDRAFDGLLAGPDLAVAVIVVVSCASAGWRTTQGRVGIVWAALCGGVALALGRHYLVDELAGVALGLGAWSVARSVVPVAEDPAP